MKTFRILQTQHLTESLPYEVEELTHVWYLSQPVWRPLRERLVLPFTLWPAIKRFQTPKVAGVYIERLVAARTRKQAEQLLRQQEHQLRELSPVADKFNPAALG